MIAARIAARAGSLSLDVELEAGAGGLALVGPNGAGKSTLLAALLGVVPVDRGRIRLGGDVLLDTEAGVDVPPELRRIAWVPQDYALLPHLDVRGNLEFAVRSRRDAAAAERIDALLRELSLEALADRRPRSLSGGERQKVALARALATQPRALLLDEPLAALDVHARREVRSFLASWLAGLSIPWIVVTHDPADARALAGRIAVIEAGRIVQVGSWDELAARPATPFVAELVGTH